MNEVQYYDKDGRFTESVEDAYSMTHCRPWNFNHYIKAEPEKKKTFFERFFSSGDIHDVYIHDGYRWHYHDRTAVLGPGYYCPPKPTDIKGLKR